MVAIPLVRTEGKVFTDGEPTLDAKKFIAETPLQVASRSTKARAAEQAFRLGDCLYFYAGYACPRFGNAVLVYEPTTTSPSGGHATPFDSGGLYLGLIHAQGAENPESRQNYCATALVHLAQWPVEADRFLDSYFDDVDAYVRGERAKSDDPSRRLQHVDNTREAWTWEVRFHDDHPMLQGLLFAVVSADYVAAVRLELLKPGIESTVRNSWLTRLRDGTVHATKAGESPHDDAEQRIIAWIHKQTA